VRDVHLERPRVAREAVADRLGRGLRHRCGRCPPRGSLLRRGRL
jgi:hypothetical protein